MVRSFHKLLRYRHALLQYVDDLLCLLDKCSAPLWASLLVIFCRVLGIPLSWHKCLLSETLTWIGWQLDTFSWRISITKDKLAVIQQDVSSCLSNTAMPVKTLEKLIGRLLWLTSLWHFCRPLLGPLYCMLRTAPSSLFGFSTTQWEVFVQHLDQHLCLTMAWSHPHISVGARVTRVANFHVSTLAELTALPLKGRRIYAMISDPAAANRDVSSDGREALQAWWDILHTTPLSHSMIPPHRVEVCAAADAMASMNQAGFGGHARLPDGRHLWFRFSMTLGEAQQFFPFQISNMQSFICVWELLAQFALSWIIWKARPVTCGFVVFPQLCDNSGAEASSHKGLSSTPGLQWLLGIFFKWQRRRFIVVATGHTAGEHNVIADGLSRAQPCTAFGLSTSDEFQVCWKDLCNTDHLCLQPSSGKWPASFSQKAHHQVFIWVVKSVHCGVDDSISLFGDVPP